MTAAGGADCAMGKKHKKHKAEKAEWRSASATAYSGKSWGSTERGGPFLYLGTRLPPPPPSPGACR